MLTVSVVSWILGVEEQRIRTFLLLLSVMSHLVGPYYGEGSHV